MRALLVLLLAVSVQRANPSAFPRVITVAAAGPDNTTEHFAARVLAERLGTVLHPAPRVVVTKGPQERGQAQIAVGHGAALAVGVPASVLGSLGGGDAYILTTKGLSPPGSVAVGAAPDSDRGSMNGVYALLRQLGFHDLAVNASTRPTATELRLPPAGFERVVRPAFEQREAMASGVASCCCTCAATNLSGALSLNGIHAHGPAGMHTLTEWHDRYAVGAQVAQSSANVFDLLAPNGTACRRPESVWKKNGWPPNQLCPSVFEAHPDWFVCRNASNRSAAEPLGSVVYPCTAALAFEPWQAQPCWSVPALVEELTAALRRILRANPTVLRPVATVSQMDGNPLVCPLDQAINDAENTAGGAQFRALNAIASTLAPEFPNATFSTLAYHGTREPPKKLKFHSSVMVRVCIDSVDPSVPLTHARNAEWAARLTHWASAAKVWVWDYVTRDTPNLAPDPTYLNIGPNLEFLSGVGVRGYYADATADVGQDMSELKLYLVGRKSLEPDVNTSALIDRFTDGFYGAAAAPLVREYLDQMAAAMARWGAQPDDGEHGWAGSEVFGNGTFLSAASTLAEARQAAATAGSDVQRQRLTTATMPLQFIALVRWAELRAFAAAQGRSWPFAPSLREEFDRFATAFNRSGVPYISQGAAVRGRCGYHCTLAQFEAQVFGH